MPINFTRDKIGKVFFIQSAPNVTIEIISADDKCFEAIGQHSQLKDPLSIWGILWASVFEYFLLAKMIT